MATDDLAARPWLLLAGTLCTPAIFDGFLDALNVPLALRSSIDLNKPTVADYRRAFDGISKETVVCAFSLGAIAAAHNADHIAAHRLVLFGFNPFPDPPDREPGRHALARDVTTLGGAAALAMRAPEMYGATPDAARALVYRMADQSASLIAAQTALAIGRPGALAALARCRTRVLVLTGSLDAVAPQEQGRAAAQAATDGHFQTMDGLGHFALAEDPAACANALMHLEGRVRDTGT